MNEGEGGGDVYIEDEESVGLLSQQTVQQADIIHSNEIGSSWYASVFLVVNAALGAGLLNFPVAFSRCGGLAIAIGVQAVLMVFIIGALLILVYCSNIHQSATYQDVVYSMCGRKWQLACAGVIVIYSFGTCITFFVIIGDQWDAFFTFSYGADFCLHWFMNRKFTIVSTSLVLILPLCFPKRIDFLKYASFLGFLAVAYCVVLVTAKYFVLPKSQTSMGTRPASWVDVFSVVPTICFSYQCHLSVVPIYACLRKRNMTEFSKMVLVAMVICVFAYTVTASFGYLTFGDKVNDDVLLSYKPTYDVLLAVVLVALKMYTTYPILLFIGRAALDSLWLSLCHVTPDDVISGELRRRISVTVIWFGSSLSLAVIVPNITVVIDLLGSLAAIFIFTFPGLCLLQVLLQRYVHPDDSRWRYRLLFAMTVGYLIIGMFIFGLVTTQSIWDDVDTHNKKPIHGPTCQNGVSTTDHFYQ